MQKTGQVICRRIGTGSKSERTALLLATAEGDFILRRMGGNPFTDSALENLVGQTVRCEGEVSAGNTFLAREILPVKSS